MLNNTTSEAVTENKRRIILRTEAWPQMSPSGARAVKMIFSIWIAAVTFKSSFLFIVSCIFYSMIYFINYLICKKWVDNLRSSVVSVLTITPAFILNIPCILCISKVCFKIYDQTKLRNHPLIIKYIYKSCINYSEKERKEKLYSDLAAIQCIFVNNYKSIYTAGKYKTVVHISFCFSVKRRNLLISILIYLF